MSRLLTLTIVLATCFGCQRATRFPARTVDKAPGTVKIEAQPIWGWTFPFGDAFARSSGRGVPIRFVTFDQPEWSRLPNFWNPSPPTVVLVQGHTPLGMIAGFLALAPREEVAVKVPRGLPDPTPGIPACNPPTVAKWRLGRKIFHDRALLAGTTTLSCADCHQPDNGFTERRAVSLEGKRNTLSLVNVAFNRSQFWDGRVRDLEETLVRSLDDEIDANSARLTVLQSHRFGGVARRLDKIWDYRDEFRDAFGSNRVTQDAVAKALATYLRTIVSGDSLYDRAAARAGGNVPGRDDFRAELPPGEKSDARANDLARGAAVFFGKGACVVCHPPPLFTDHGYHNVGVDDSSLSQAVSGKETGRFAVLPVGLKDPSMRGAYRTPALRNVAATWPYFHDGTRTDLKEAVEYFRQHLELANPLLAPALRDRLAAALPEAPGLHPTLFSSTESDALVEFLRSLDGRPVDARMLGR